MSYTQTDIREVLNRHRKTCHVEQRFIIGN